MAYTTIRGGLAELRSPTKLEKAMKQRDLNGRELSSMANVSREIVSRLRRGTARTTRTVTAKAIEKTLRVEPGTIFDFGEDS